MKILLNKPIFLLSSERSGTNLLSRIFGNHPNICAPAQAHLFNVFNDCGYTYRSGTDELRKAVLELFRAKPSFWKLDHESDSEILGLLKNYETPFSMCAALYRAEQSRSGATTTFVKENYVSNYLPPLIGISDAPRFLHLVRDPRDMAASWQESAVLRGGVIRATDRWLNDQRRIIKIWQELSSSYHTSFLKYEDLLKDPTKAISRVCNELEIDFHQDMTTFSSARVDNKLNSSRSTLWSNLGGPLIKNNTKKYLKKLNNNQIAYIERIACEEMEYFEYMPTLRGATENISHCDLNSLRDQIAHLEVMLKPEFELLEGNEKSRFLKWSEIAHRMRSRTLASLQNVDA